jgi:hypothetical protein
MGDLVLKERLVDWLTYALMLLYYSSAFAKNFPGFPISSARLRRTLSRYLKLI